MRYRWLISLIAIFVAIGYAIVKILVLGSLDSLEGWFVGLLSVTAFCSAPKASFRIVAGAGLVIALIILWQSHIRGERLLRETREYGLLYDTMEDLYEKLSVYSERNLTTPSTNLDDFLRAAGIYPQETNFLKGITVTVYPLPVHPADSKDFIVFSRNNKYATVSQTGSVNLPFDFCR